MEKHQIGKEAQKKKEEGKEWKITMDCKKNSTNICETHFRVDRESATSLFFCFFFSLGLHFYDQTQYPERRKDWSMFFFGIFLVSFYFWFCSTILHGGFCYQEMFAQK